MSRTEQKSSFKKALGWTFGLLMVFFLLLRLFVFEPQREFNFQQALINANEATLVQLSDALVTPVLQRKLAALYALLDSQLEKDSWRRMRVTDSSGRQIYPMDDWQPVVPDTEILIEQDLVFEGKTIGHIHLVLDFSAELRSFREGAYLSEGIQALIIGLGLIAMFVYHRRFIDEPLHEMANAMGELTLHNFDYPLPESRFREIADLTRVFEHTREDVKEFQQRLIELKQQADRASDAKSQFLSNMSHELRTPLNAIMGFTDLLRVDADQNLRPRDKHYLDNIANSARVLLELISQLLDLAQIESGQHELNPQDIALGTLIDECVELVQPVAQRRGVEVVHLSSSYRDAHAWADLMRVRQVLLNFLSNGIKYGSQEAGARVVVSCEQLAQQRVRIVVQDNGAGIPPEGIARLFKRFERLDAQNTNIEGTGIGLFLCKQLVEAMDGTIGVSSQMGVGTHFWFELPCPVAEQVAIDETDAGERSLPRSRDIGEGATLLYIDDSNVNLALISALITSHTALEILTAEVPEDGLQLALDQQPDLILLDLRMPGMDGFEVLARLKDDDRTRNIPVIAYTANAMSVVREGQGGAEFDDVLTKPVSLEKLLVTLEQYLPNASA